VSRLESFAEQARRIASTPRLRAEFGWVLANKIAELGLQFALLKVLTTRLGKKEYGEFNLAETAVMLVGTIVLMPVHEAYMRDYHGGIARGYKRSAALVLIRWYALATLGTALVLAIEAVEETEDWIRGPLLVTGFAQEATPRFRYRIGDVGTRSKHPCPCGRPGEVFLDVDGRIEDYVATPDGRLVGRMDHVFKDQHEVAEAQIQQQHAREIEVLLVPLGAWREETGRSVTKELRARLGEEIGIRIRVVDAIPREPNGKFRAVKSAVGRVAG
jgi:hypothetical protein